MLFIWTKTRVILLQPPTIQGLTVSPAERAAPAVKNTTISITQQLNWEGAGCGWDR